jgi:seryl-tRNA synthetase
LPYHVIDTCTGDLGGPAYRKFDLEAWMPGRGEAGEYGEVTSTSNCTDYQARRLGIRYKHKGEKGTHFAHTLSEEVRDVSEQRSFRYRLPALDVEEGKRTVNPRVIRDFLICRDAINKACEAMTMSKITSLPGCCIIY